jgi:predicted membrane chloride channel (bestrophin family)
MSCTLTLAIIAYDNFHPHSWPPIPRSGLEPFSLTGSALSLLLVFRTDASYSRWDTGRKLFGDLIVRSRDIVRQACTHFTDESAMVDLLRWVVAFGVCARLQLEEASLTTLHRELSGWLSPAELDELQEARHRSHFCLQILSELVENQRDSIDSAMFSAMDYNVQALETFLGSSERIFRTPLPLSYTRHTSRCLLLWLSALPIGLYNEIGSEAAIAAPIITFFFIGIDQIAAVVENPFSSLPLRLLTNKVKFNSLEMITKRHRVRKMVGGSSLRNGNPIQESDGQSILQEVPDARPPA